MVDYDFATDCLFIRNALGLTQSEFAQKIGVSFVMVSHYETGKNAPKAALMERVYRLAEDNGISVNLLKTRFLEDDAQGKKLLFHGSRGGIQGEIDLSHGNPNSDFGIGFYAGETFRQAATWVNEFPGSSVYCFYFEPTGLKGLNLDVGRDWMLAVCFFRGYLPGKESHPVMAPLLQRIDNADYILAPIADNVMYETLREFSEGFLTDQQCLHAISANRLGYQYVFRTDKALGHLEARQRLFLSQNERREYDDVKHRERNNGIAKLRVARIEYQNKGEYVDAVFA